MTIRNTTTSIFIDNVLFYAVSIIIGCTATSCVEKQQYKLVETKKHFVSQMFAQSDTTTPPPPTDPTIKLVYYNAPLGKNPAYISGINNDGAKHPAIVWIIGGDCNSIGDYIWSVVPASNDQTARVFATNGIVTMFPSLRGGNTSKGKKEFFYGEIDDIIAAADYLRKLPYVDSNRIYLGGHSTGGTMVLLCAASTSIFKKVFSFAPVAYTRGYDAEIVLEDSSNIGMEYKLRSPAYWMNEIRTPTFIYEGTEQPSNIESLRYLAQIGKKNPQLHFQEIPNKDHFSSLRPLSEEIAINIATGFY